MKIVVPGGTGHLGHLLANAWMDAGHEVVVLSRRSGQHPTGVRVVRWDGRSIGDWATEVDGADAVVNLAGRSVNCRYSGANLREMMDSRVTSATVVGAAIAEASRPPRVWLQMSTATIYAHSYERANDEDTGVLGGAEDGVPAYWSYSVAIARSWEAAQDQVPTPHSRKVALRTAVVMAPGRGGAFALMRRMCRCGLGGPVAGGRQYVSWIHGRDFVRAVDFLLSRDDIAGPVNVASPNPVPYRTFMADLRRASGVPMGLPAMKWMAEIGAFVLRTDTELLLKSRRVVPGRLLAMGYDFEFPDWPDAARDLTVTSHQ